MEIKTKYNIGDAVYILDDMRVHKANIAGVFFQKLGASPNSIQYKFAVFPTKKECECFESVESLIKYITR